MFFERDRYPTETNLTCPITGDVLMALPVEMGVMDPMHLYEAKNDDTYRYARHPFSWNIFTQIYKGTDGWGGKSLSHWKLNDDNSWTEMMTVKELSGTLFPKDTPQSEIDDAIREDREKREARMQYLKEHPEEALPIFNFKQVTAKTIGMDLVSVQPMSAPSNLSLFVDFKYESDEDKVTYPYLVTEENIEELKKVWKLEEYAKYKEHGDIQVGDKIDDWQTGGGLSMRRGETVVRNNEVIYTRLTAMS